MSCVPTGWTSERLKDVAAINAAALSAGTDPDYEFDYLEISNVNYHGVVDPNAIEHLRFEDAPSRARRRVAAGSTLISSVRPNLQAVAFFADVPAHLICSTGFNVVEPQPSKLSPQFVYYHLLSENARQYFEAAATGVGYPAIGDKDFNALHVPLPPLPEQQRIVAYLDASCAAIDAAVSAKRRQLDTLDTLCKSIIIYAVTKGLAESRSLRSSGVTWFGDIPKHWKCATLKRFTTRIQAGMTPPTDRPEYYEDGTIPWFAPGSFDGKIELTEPRKLINEIARRDRELRMFPAGSVFLVGIGATIGKVGMIVKEASCNQQLLGLVCGCQILPRYLAYQFKIYEEVIPGLAIATTLPIFDQVKTGYLPTLCPPLTEQAAICTHLDEKTAEVDRIATTITAQIATLSAYRKSLIHECVTGQRRVTEADMAGDQLSENARQVRMSKLQGGGSICPPPTERTV